MVNSESLKNLPLKLFVSGFYIGALPISGTFGSLWGIVIFLALKGNPWLCIAAAAAIYVAGCFAATSYENLSGKDDPGFVIVDEIVGMIIALLWAPMSVWYVVAAFVIFRGFDIVKPPPARQFDRMHGGFGIMTDDVFAGIYSLIAMQVGMYVWGMTTNSGV